MSNKLGFGGGPMFDLFRLSTVVLNVFCLSLVLHSDMHELYFVFINCALILFLDSALWLVAEVRIHSHSSQSPLHVFFIFYSHIVHDLGEYPLTFSLIATSVSLY